MAKTRQNTTYFGDILRYFQRKKSARRVRTPRAHLQLPQTTPRKPQEPRRTFFSAKNGLKMAKNHSLILRYVALFLAQKKCAEGAHPVYT